MCRPLTVPDLLVSSASVTTNLFLWVCADVFFFFPRYSLTRKWMSFLITRYCQAEGPSSWHKQLLMLLELHITTRGRMWSLIPGGRRWGKDTIWEEKTPNVYHQIIELFLLMSCSCRKIQSPDPHSCVAKWTVSGWSQRQPKLCGVLEGCVNGEEYLFLKPT